ncbi:MAG: hypothetical protein LBD14_02440 [Puniceicoccales bacterium]|nr:hypothetical protein [Puniceicoccales bacterium]
MPGTERDRRWFRAAVCVFLGGVGLGAPVANDRWLRKSCGCEPLFACPFFFEGSD